jgi:hypothetical protein
MHISDRAARFFSLPAIYHTAEIFFSGRHSSSVENSRNGGGLFFSSVFASSFLKSTGLQT